MKQFDWLSRIPESVAQLIQVLDDRGFETWLVGGCVRDMALGIIPEDYDIASNARPEDVCQIFERCLKTGLKHGTVTVLLKDLSIEVTTFRSEGPYSDGRRPDHVRYEMHILPDLARRDFTINSMAWHPERGLLDPYHGLADLQMQTLRCVGSADLRLQEDALRQLRAVRFALTYDLKPDSELIDAVARHHGGMIHLSPERIGNELMRLVRAPYAHHLVCFSGTQLLSQVTSDLFSKAPEDTALCLALTCFVQPFWQKEQVWPALYLACLMAEQNAEPVDTQHNGLPDAFHLSDWLSIRHDLTRSRLDGLYRQMVHSARLSRHLAGYTQAILLFIGQRLLLLAAELRRNRWPANGDADVSLDEKQILVLLRTAKRITRLTDQELLDSFDLALSMLHSLQADPVFGNCLDRERQRIRSLQSSTGQTLVSVHQLMINGRSPVFDMLADRRQTGLFLERALSFCQQSNEWTDLHALDQLVADWIVQADMVQEPQKAADEWTRPRDSTTAN